jgi:ABC-2 type transport system permease protein
MRAASLRELTLARLREFTREPEAVFWTFVFPLLLAGGLAIAFRDKAPEQSIIAIVAAPANDAAAAATSSALMDAARDSASPLVVREISADSATEVLRTGTASLVVVPLAGGRVERVPMHAPRDRW